jgi:hypothetical protein
MRKFCQQQTKPQFGTINEKENQMKKAELKKLVEEYKSLKKLSTRNSQNNYKVSEKLREIRHRYFHETGQELDLEEQDETK